MTDDGQGGHDDQGHGDHEHDDPGHGDHGHDDHGHGGDEDLRVTSPMQEFTSGQVGLGFVVLLVGLAVTVGVPLLLA